MAGLIHASILILLPIATVGLCVRAGERPSARRILLSCLGAGVIGLATFLAGVHGCGLGTPLAQWVIPATCMGATLMFVRLPWLRYASAVALAVLGLGLSLHYADIVHGPTFVGVAAPEEEYGVRGTEAEWHTWLTGLYRRASQ